MPKVDANGIQFEVERHGAGDATPLLLIRGLGTQLIHWPPALIDGFMRDGFHVVAYDNRDVGLSTHFDACGLPDLDRVREAVDAGQAAEVPYTLEDMADDAVGLLDALDIPTAHVLGMSMGGMILQLMAHRYPDRVRSAAIVMSSSGGAHLPPPRPEIERLLSAQADDPNDREGVVDHELNGDRAWASPGFPFDEAERRELIGRAYDRSYHPAGVARQYAAIIANGSRVDLLRSIRVPALVIHGSDDALLSIEHGRDIAANIPNAEWLEIEGMGHDLEGGIQQRVVAATTRFAKGVENNCNAA